jgi:hypothetical protein
LRQLAKLIELCVEMGQAEVHTHQNDGRDQALGGCQMRRCAQADAAAGSPSPEEKFTARPGTMVEMACL